MTSGVLFFFLLAILNLGDLGLILSAMQHGAEAAARQAVVQLSANVATSGAAAVCPTSSAITGYFNNYASPPLPAVSAAAGAPTLTPSWTNNGGAANANMPPVTYLQLTANYTWQPIGMPSFFRTGITLKISTVAAAMGTTGITTTC